VPAPGSLILEVVTSARIPARHFADHPLACGLSLAGSGGTALYARVVAVRPGQRHWVMWLALGVHCAAQFARMVAATKLTRRQVRVGGCGDRHMDSTGQR